VSGLAVVSPHQASYLQEDGSILMCVTTCVRTPVAPRVPLGGVPVNGRRTGDARGYHVASVWLARAGRHYVRLAASVPA
jgi:hypothetical protein